MQTARRVENLASAIFNEMEQVKKKVEAGGTDVINLGVGSPDLPPAPHIIEAMRSALGNYNNYRYPLEGMPRLCKALADWYKRRFNVDVNPDEEILVLMGSQDGLGHMALAYVNPGDVALIPDPGYPIYSCSVYLAEGNIYSMPLLEENDFLPDLDNIPEDTANRAKLMWLNYPNNPVAVSANREFYEKVVDFAKKYDVIICHDAAYTELAYDGFKPMSFLEVPGAKDVGVEFYSLSKTYNMAGCRIGFAVGNSQILEPLGRIKSNIDFGVFKAIQEAGIAALEGNQDCVERNASNYQARRDILVDGLTKLGWHMPKPQSSMFVWAPLPGGRKSSRDFAFEMLEKAGVLVIPGVAFGDMGEGYVRIGLVQDKELLQKAVDRIGKVYTF
ncbi:MAG: LL-diaminopimelate aminotransferase [Clostridiales bacterium]|nr:LL-diaminopimelate aminotransferase [Clostridiales bacterium]